MKKFFRIFIYAAGMLILAFALVLNSKTGLGVTPIISVSYAISEITGGNFGDITFWLYALFVALQIVIHMIIWRRRHRLPAGSLARQILLDILQIPLSFGFTRFMNVFSGMLPRLDTDLAGTFWGSMGGRLLVLGIAIVLTGAGAAMTLAMRLIPNPGDGIVQAVSDLSGWSVGLAKNIMDVLNISVAIVIGLIGSGRLVSVGIGTAVAVVGVGRMVALFNHFFLEKMQAAAGMEE